MTIQTAILTVSDRISKGKAFDKTGEILFKTLEETGKYNVNERRLTSDDLDEIKLNLKDLAARVNLIVTTGGTGFSQRDNTPEAVIYGK